MSVNPETFKAVMGQWPSGVTVITTEDAEGFGGMTASSFSSVSLNPPLISICVARYLRMHDRIREAGRFAVNILSKDSQEHGMRFAGMLPGVEDRFAGVVGRTPVGLRPGAGPMALANVLVALKSGVHHLSAASDTDHYVAMPDLVDMLQRMQVGILPAAALA